MSGILRLIWISFANQEQGYVTSLGTVAAFGICRGRSGGDRPGASEEIGTVVRRSSMADNKLANTMART